MYIGLPTKNGQKTRQLRGQRRVPRAGEWRWPCHATRCKQGGSHVHCNAAPARSAAPDRRGPARARVRACTRRGRDARALPRPPLLFPGPGSLLQRDGSASSAETSVRPGRLERRHHTHLQARMKKQPPHGLLASLETRAAEGRARPPPARRSHKPPSRTLAAVPKRRVPALQG